ncbi:MAG: hypothetical protein ACOZNI_06910 [Myxococcota bacterium]
MATTRGSSGLFGKPEALLVDEEAPRILMPLPPPVAMQPPVDEWAEDEAEEDDEDEEDDDSVDTAGPATGGPLRLFLGNARGRSDAPPPDDVFDLSAALGEEPASARAPQLSAMESDEPPPRRREVFAPSPRGGEPRRPLSLDEGAFAASPRHGDLFGRPTPPPDDLGNLEARRDELFGRPRGGGGEGFTPGGDPARTEEPDGPTAADLFGRGRGQPAAPGTFDPSDLDELGSAFGFRAPSRKELEDILREEPPPPPSPTIEVPVPPLPAPATEPEMNVPRPLFKQGSRLRSMETEPPREELPADPFDNYGEEPPPSHEHVKTSRVAHAPGERPATISTRVQRPSMEAPLPPFEKSPPPSRAPASMPALPPPSGLDALPPAQSVERPLRRGRGASAKELPPEPKHYVPLKVKASRDWRRIGLGATVLVVVAGLAGGGWSWWRANRIDVPAHLLEGPFPDVPAMDAGAGLPVAAEAPAPKDPEPVEPPGPSAGEPASTQPVDPPPADPPEKAAEPTGKPASTKATSAPADAPAEEPVAPPKKPKAYVNPFDQTGLLRISCDGGGRAVVFIDGKRHGPCDNLPPLEMSSGMHKIKATLGGKSRTIEARVDPGTMREVQIRFE